MLFGVLAAQFGQILWQGSRSRIGSPSAARKLGIGMVFQHFSLFEALTVAENIALSLDDGSLDQEIAEAKARALSQSLWPAARSDMRSCRRSLGRRAPAHRDRPRLLQNPKLIILDEPTSVLTPQEADKLFETLEQAEGRGPLGPLYQPPAGRGAAHLRPRHRAAPRQGHRRLRSAPGDRRRRWPA
jgi:ABC-type uncharacterized transport system ATPase subunit